MPNGLQFTLRAGKPEIGDLRIYDVIGAGLFGGISAEDVAAKLDGFKGRELHVFINSPGGNAYDGIAIYNALKRFEGQKTIHVDGLAASAASLIAMAGDKIVTAPNAQWMIHEASTFASGNAAALRKRADLAEKLSESVADTYCRRTGRSAEDVRRWMRDETWMNAAEAKARGFTDEISDEEPEGAIVENSAAERVFALFERTPPEAARFFNLAPAAPQSARKGAEEKPMKNLLAKMGLSETATEAEALVAFERLQSERAELVAATGAADATSAAATIAGLRAKASRADELQAQITKLEAAQRQAEVTALLDEATADGRLTPAKRVELTAADAPGFARDPAALKVFLGCLQKAAPAPREPAAPAPSALSKEALDVAKQMGVDPKDLAANAK